MKSFPCTECRVSVVVPHASIKTATCKRCGEVYLMPSQSRMYPSLHMVPVDRAGVLSRWMPTQSRPIEQGLYDCRFRHTEPVVYRLYWNGSTFLTTDGRRVSLLQFLTWRGMLA